MQVSHMEKHVHSILAKDFQRKKRKNARHVTLYTVFVHRYAQFDTLSLLTYSW